MIDVDEAKVSRQAQHLEGKHSPTPDACVEGMQEWKAKKYTAVWAGYLKSS